MVRAERPVWLGQDRLGAERRGLAGSGKLWLDSSWHGEVSQLLAIATGIFIDFQFY